MTERGFFVGRFQPFHRGHRRVLATVADELDELVVGIGSAGASHTLRNPFTAGERMMMITKTVSAADIDLVTYPVPIEDIERNSVWVSHVRSLCPPFDVAYSHNPLVVRLFEEAGVAVEEFPLFDRDRLEGTRIREAMVDGEEWRPLVPEQVADVVDEVDGVARLRRLAGTDAAGTDSPPRTDGRGAVGRGRGSGDDPDRDPTARGAARPTDASGERTTGDREGER